MQQEDNRVEAVARAICEAVGLDPDRQTVLEKNVRDRTMGPQWQKFVVKAKEHIAAFDKLKQLGDNTCD